ncbi:glutamine--tRNA ligase/YqeY domain fusion protein [Thermosyntropha sp.]|uniref:glutamine--tRNA ligase/YqeY domain fusion protein n=1 Tax=Thermosyntropha sp. TaxID=2740820 RepID=UPI0025D514C2|nr:glutamine--tRNA ligase/YqeY domain fusion protein [Thermosyntropha sp.]MBO8159620.1 glutamine--tRNA ligase/YqeY domain fusion protein [Thermosyntropha sp.]
MSRQEEERLNAEGILNDNEREEEGVNFIEEIIREDLKNGKNDGRVHTRFPPEPNGYLHIGHAKAICIDFGMAEKYGGLCNLRFDDTNPTKEDTEYVESIKRDIRWLGFDWGDRLYYASDYFDKMYEYAVQLIKKGKAYVCDLSAEEIKEYRGTLTEPGKESPYRNRSVEENLDLFERMKNGEFPEGSKVLRAKIDMASGNINMRDPVLYRIQYATHHRTGDKWCIYPMYDYAHPIEDALEGITHSLCTLEFADHRPLYEWVLDNVDYSKDAKGRPRQIEFARLNLTYTVMSKRKLKTLVEEGYVRGWDDPRMPTISGLRRRGYTPEAIRDFCERIGVARRDSIVDIALLEHCVRDDLNKRAPRAMVVLNPLKVVIKNYPEGQVEWLETENNPEMPEMGVRKIPFSREIYIEREDFMEDPPKKFFRLKPGGEVRLKSAYIIRCEEVVKDPETGEIIELICTYDPESKSGGANAGRKVKGTLHWVDAAHAVPCEVRLYERLFTVPDPDNDEDGRSFTEKINPDSLKVLTGCLAEINLKGAKTEDRFQFLRHGYFCVDPDSTEEILVFNRIVSLKDTWAKMKNKA